MLKKTFGLCILVLTAWMLSLSVQANEQEVNVYITFDKQSYQASDVMKLTMHVENYQDLFGFQIDLKKDFNNYTTKLNIDPYDIPTNAIFISDTTVWINEINDDIASLLVSKDLEQEQGFNSIEGVTVLATIDLVANQAISNPYDLIAISNNLDDLLYDTYNLIIKLSDSDANPIPYQVVQGPLSPPILSLNPGVDTIHQGGEHLDAGIQVIYSGDYQIEVISDLNTNQIGTYTITYNVSYLEELSSIVRYVHVISKPKEVIFTLTLSVTTIPVGGTFHDQGCEVSVDGVISQCVIISNALNTNQEGAYEIVYGVIVDEVTYTHIRYVFVFKIYQNVLFPSKKEEFDI